LGVLLSYRPIDLKIAFTDKEITPWSGMVFMKKLLDRTGILTRLIACDLPEQGSNRGYSPIQLLTCFMVSVWCGANRFEHLEISRFDEVLRKIFGFRRMAGHKAYQRYFSKFTIAINQKVFTKINQWFFSQEIFVIGGDITRSGNQRLLNLSLSMKRRKWIEGIWNESQNFTFYG